MAQFSSNRSTESNASAVNETVNALDLEERIFIWTVSVIEIPLILLTLVALCFLIKSHHAGSVYVLHLIFSDLLQTLMMLFLTTPLMNARLWSAYKYTLTVGLLFMACIASERYVLVSHPHWYRFHHSIKTSCFISAIIWLAPLTFAQLKGDEMFTMLSQCLAFCIPYVIIVLCFAGTWCGLSNTISLTSRKRILVLGSLSLVLLIYTFLILPLSITSFCILILEPEPDHVVHKVYVFSHYPLYLNPLADCLLYLFLRSDVDKIIKSLYCCRNSSIFNTVSATTQQ